MVTVTELNRAPNITVNAIDAASVSADALEADSVTFNQDITDADNNTVTSLSDPVRVTEEASTFAETNVTVANSSTNVSDGSVKLEDGSSVTRAADNGSTDISDGYGIVINPNTSISEITVTLSSNTGAVNSVFLADNTETILAEKTAGYTGGDEVTLSASLNAGDDYYLGVYDNGNTYTVGKSTNVSFPNTSEEIDMITGVFDAHPDDGETATESNSAAYAVQSVSSPDSTSGNAFISFDSGSPADIDSWDLATFQRTLDGETVTVDVVQPITSDLVIDDLEDGNATVEADNWSGWSGTTANISAQQSTVISGAYSGELTSANEQADAIINRDSATDNDFKFSVNAEQTSNSTDYFQIVIEDDGDNFLYNIGFNDDGTVELYNGSDNPLSYAWTANADINVECQHDFANNEVTVIIDGANQGTFDFFTSVSGFAYFRLRNSTLQSTETRSVYFDNVVEVNGKTTYSALLSDIGPNVDISTISTSTNVTLRANLSRSNTANNPTLDYAARRFTR